jgi:hypothetical protein
MDVTKLLFACLALIVSSILAAPASVYFGIRWATATDISYLLLTCGIILAMFTIRAEKYEDNTAVLPQEYSEATHDIYSPEKPHKRLYIQRGPNKLAKD